MSTTLLQQLVNPEVMADAISAELPAKLATLGYMKVDTTLVGKAGNTVTIPRFNYVGPAADLAENTEGSVDVLSATEVDYTVKKAVKNVELTDEAVLSGYGDPVGEVQKQLKNAIADKIDNDAIELLLNEEDCPNIDMATQALSVMSIVKAANDFDGENKGQAKYLLISQEGLAQLMASTDVLDSSTLTEDMMVNGVIGKVGGCYVIPSNKLYWGGATGVTRNAYILTKDAITAFLKRDVSLETERNVLYKKTLFSADEHYTVAIEDMNKVRSITHKNENLGSVTGAVYNKDNKILIQGLFPLVSDAMEGGTAYAYFKSSPMKATFGATKTSLDSSIGTAKAIAIDTDITTEVEAAKGSNGICFMYVAYYDTDNKLRYGANVKINTPVLFKH